MTKEIGMIGCSDEKPLTISQYFTYGFEHYLKEKFPEEYRKERKEFIKGGILKEGDLADTDVGRVKDIFIQ
ncbi:MAG: hypothetical protein HZA83_01480 [Thaumarchaeota archaeon]|nr:hypothetical protein [Nitrososphaerota archaeon]